MSTYIFQSKFDPIIDTHSIIDIYNGLKKKSSPLQ